MLLLSAAICCSLTIAAGPDAPHHPRVIIIGLDAASMNIIGPLVDAGMVPNLAGLISSGAHGDFASLWPMRTPQIWTTIVTGKYPGQHGIWDHYSSTKYSPPKLRSEKQRVLTTKHRRSKAVWNILDAADIPIMSVGWIASWPAERLSDTSLMLAPIVLANSKRQVSIKGTFWKDQKHQVHPERLWPRVRDMITEGPSLGDDDVADFASLPADGDPLYQLPYLRGYVRALKWSVARARSVEALTLELFDQTNPELLMLYFQCTDSLLHRFWIFQKSEEEIVERLSTHSIPTRHAAQLRQRFGRVTQACYQDIDARIGRVLAKTRGADTMVMVISDHGFGEAPFPHPKKTEPYGGNHRDMGVIIAAAPWIDPASQLKGVSVLDIMPTLLHAFEQPVAKDMPGKLVPALLPPDRRARPPALIESYEKKPQKKIPYKNGWPARRFRPLAEDR